MTLAALMATVLRLALVVLPAFLIAPLRATLVSIAASMGTPLALASLTSLLLELVGLGTVVSTLPFVSVAASFLRAAVGPILLIELVPPLGPLTAILSLSGLTTVLEVRFVYRVGFEPAVLLSAALSLPSGLSASSLGLLAGLSGLLLRSPLSAWLLSLLALLFALSLLSGLLTSSLGLLLVVLGPLLGKSLSRFARSVGFLSPLALPFVLSAPFVVTLRSLSLAPAVFGALRADVATATAAIRVVEPASVVAVLTPVVAAVLLVAVTLLAAAAFGAPLVSPSSVAVVSVVHG